MAEHITPPANDSFTVNEQPADDWTVVEVFNTEFEASVAAGALQSEGIPASLTGGTFGSVLPIGFNSIGGVRLWVPSAMADQALLILRRNRNENLTSSQDNA